MILLADYPPPPEMGATRKEYKAWRKQINRLYWLERKELRHRKRMERAENGESRWRRLVFGLVDFAAHPTIRAILGSKVKELR